MSDDHSQSEMFIDVDPIKEHRENMEKLIVESTDRPDLNEQLSNSRAAISKHWMRFWLKRTPMKILSI